MPTFLARPAGAPVYHGFPVIDGVEADGFRLGMITDFLSEPAREGDAYVIAPDGSRAGLVWESGCVAYFRQVLAPEEGRWGVWAVGLPLPMTTVEEARSYLQRWCRSSDAAGSHGAAGGGAIAAMTAGHESAIVT